MRLIIDGHLDLAMSALLYGRDITRSVEQINAAEAGLTDDRCRGHAMVSLPQMRAGGVGLCFATLLARSGPAHAARPALARVDLDYINQDAAYAMARAQLAYYQRLHNRGQIRIIQTRTDLEDHWALWNTKSEISDSDERPIGIILTMECADPIVEPEQVEHWRRLGLRMVMPTHSAAGQYAGGNASGGGLTMRGRTLLRAMQRHGILLDLSHLSDESTAQALDLYDGPVIASHSNCRALVPGPRQISDPTIVAVACRGGVIGIAIFNCFLTDGWDYNTSPRDQVALDRIVDHLDHICQLAGNCEHVAIGSDLDGGYGCEATPMGIDTIADLQKLAEVLATRRFADAQIEAIFHRNWLRVLRQTLPA